MTFELWLMHKGEELEVKLADYKEEKSRFMCRGDYGPEICTEWGNRRPKQYWRNICCLVKALFLRSTGRKCEKRRPSKSPKIERKKRW